MAAVGSPTPSAPAAWVAAAAAQTPLHAALPDQLVPRAAALRRLGDGVHRVVVRLQPEALGPVRVVAEVVGGALSVQLHATTEVGRDALRQALPELRRDMADAAGGASVDVGPDLGRGGDGSSDGRPWGRQGAPVPGAPRPAWVDGSPATRPADAVRTSPRADGSGLLDLVV
ncbi:flagellar hook-length control protein FliK [Pseudokineococcus basanitobsidens]|uniref:flagellar hook-length control protein FliK n=1 Tax=Pseudokineococcus basanitobsidens TaxID=1926649 RepID=UPI0030D9DBD5